MCDGNRCSILCLGTELTRGHIQDKHAVFLCRELEKAGLSVSRIVLIPDKKDIVQHELERAVTENDVIIVSGGLGPTSDDITRDSISTVTGKKLLFHEDLWEQIKRRYHGRRVPESNKRQALIPEGFTVMENPRGTACGFMGEAGKCRIIALPGPPTELQPMFLESVVPVLSGIDRMKAKNKRNELSASAFMVGESSLEDAYRHTLPGDVGLMTRLAEDRVIFTLYGSTLSRRETIFTRIRRVFGPIRIRKGNDSLPVLLLNRLIERKKSIVCAESCTGGLLGKWLTDIPGSSAVFWGGFITYSNKAKEKILGVGHSLIRAAGAVSGEVASAMATGALALGKTDVGIAVSGIAGPGGGTPEKPVGTVWISVIVRNKEEITKPFYFTGNRDAVRRKTAIAAFLIAESILSGEEVLDIPAEW
ncbi:MAG: CinA family nicotinamide mononucleotide deamidase-related protein [Spirochaetales bacterium]|nr:CinA family nicotinamide mononucleotide deamidase-related protein [Spirochaetales bacterium]